MTLTRRLSAEEKRVFMPAAEAHLARAIAMPRRVTDICLFVQPAPGEPFVIARTSETARLSASRKRAMPLQRAVVQHVSTGMPVGNGTVRARRSAMSAASHGARAARRAARISGGAMTSITRTGNRDAASAMTVRGDVGDATRRATSVATSAGMP